MSELIYAYTREQAIGDGVLIDVTTTAKETGLRYPAAVTAAVWNEYVAVPDACPWLDEAGRLWDILWMLRYAIGRGKNASELQFVVLVQNDERGAKEVKLKAVCGPGDQGEPVVTIMLPEED
jgi:hypothetical protein